MTDELFETMSFREQQNYLNNMTDEEVERVYKNANEQYKEEFPDDSLINYDEYKKLNRREYGCSCYVGNCDCKAEFPVYGFDGVDYGMCEKCSGIRSNYLFELWHSPEYLSRIRNSTDLENK